MRDKLQDKEEYEYVIIESTTPSLGSVFSGENTYLLGQLTSSSVRRAVCSLTSKADGKKLHGEKKSHVERV